MRQTVVLQLKNSLESWSSSFSTKPDSNSTQDLKETNICASDSVLYLFACFFDGECCWMAVYAGKKEYNGEITCFFFFLLLYSLTIKVSLFFFSALLNSRQSVLVLMTEFLKLLSKFHCGQEIRLCVLSPNVIPVKGRHFQFGELFHRYWIGRKDISHCTYNWTVDECIVDSMPCSFSHLKAQANHGGMPQNNIYIKYYIIIYI